MRQEVFLCSLPPRFLLMLFVCLHCHLPPEDEIINGMAA